jgi:broad specificity phosphatase PhoE
MLIAARHALRPSSNARFHERMATQKNKTKPLGKALDRSDDDLDRLSEIDFGDLEATAAEATPEMRELLEAETDEEDGDPGT